MMDKTDRRVMSPPDHWLQSDPGSVEGQLKSAVRFTEEIDIRSLKFGLTPSNKVIKLSWKTAAAASR